MTTANSMRITLELEAGADPISGSVEHPDGRHRSFWGWLELMEELRAGAAGEPARPPQQTPAPSKRPDASDARATRRRPPTITEEQP